jgi:hypothetical protein
MHPLFRVYYVRAPRSSFMLPAVLPSAAARSSRRVRRLFAFRRRRVEERSPGGKGHPGTGPAAEWSQTDLPKGQCVPASSST